MALYVLQCLSDKTFKCSIKLKIIAVTLYVSLLFNALVPLGMHNFKTEVLCLRTVLLVLYNWLNTFTLK